jgi:hemerythrin-like metal-binding protein
MLIVWKEDYAIDGGVIDADHRFLFDLINRILVDNRTEGHGAALRLEMQELNTFAARHFTREETLQKASGFPLNEEHHALHQVLLDQLQRATELVLELDESNTPPAKLAKLRKKLHSFLYRWLLAHVMECDVKMRPYVKGMAGTAQGYAPLSAA